MIGVIFQDYVRFAFIASENVAVGQIEEATNQPKIQNASEKSLADAVIKKLPEGYNQMLGKRFSEGIDLSGASGRGCPCARLHAGCSNRYS